MNIKQLIRKQLAPQLIALRQERGLSLQDVALQTPLSMNMICMMERGENLSSRSYRQLLKFYKKELCFVLKDKE